MRREPMLRHVRCGPFRRKREEGRTRTAPPFAFTAQGSNYAPALTGAGGFDCPLRASFTILLRCERSLRKALASVYRRGTSRLTMAFHTTRNAALGRK